MSKSISSGSSLLEVLIALSVLAICVSSLVALQLSNLQGARQSASRSRAVQIVAEMTDWLRLGASPSLADFGETLNAPTVFCDRTACTLLQMQAFEMFDWQRRINASLPGARLVVCRDGQPWDAVAGAWRWTCDAGQGSAAPVVIKLGWPERANSAIFLPLVTATVGPLP